ncbi:hypothetical protein BH09PLA1_BH09PLA1_32430 [soil metagenome]
MNRFSILLGGSVVAIASFVGFSFAHANQDKSSSQDKPVTIVGELIDTGCFVSSDGDAKGKDHAECASKCMASGVPAGILPEGKTKAADAMFLLTNPAPFAPYAAQTIKVEGIVHGENKAIDVKHAWAKDGANWKEIELKDAHHGMAGHDDSDHQHDKGAGEHHDHK